MANKPIKKWRAGNLDCSVWSNEREVNGNKVEFKTVSLRKSWRQDNLWRDQTITNLRRNDLQKAILLLQKAQEDLLLNVEKEEIEEEDE